MNNILRVSNDTELPRIIKLVKKGVLPSTETIKGEHANYNVGINTVWKTVETSCPKSVYKEELSYNENGINVIREMLQNERGQYVHSACDDLACGRETISLGGQLAFVKKDDGTYVQPALGRFSAKVVSSDAVQQAIDYVKGIGSVDAYDKLLRTCKA